VRTDVPKGPPLSGLYGPGDEARRKGPRRLGPFLPCRRAGRISATNLHLVGQLSDADSLEPQRRDDRAQAERDREQVRGDPEAACALEPDRPLPRLGERVGAASGDGAAGDDVEPADSVPGRFRSLPLDFRRHAGYSRDYRLCKGYNHPCAGLRMDRTQGGSDARSYSCATCSRSSPGGSGHGSTSTITRSPTSSGECAVEEATSGTT
jgi:hypothetical protein